MTPSHQQLADLLRLARQNLNDAYLQDQTNAYSRWKVECDSAWLAKGIMLPYSSNVSFPSEKEVIAKALELYNAQNPPPAVPLVQSVPIASTTLTLIQSDPVIDQPQPIAEIVEDVAALPIIMDNPDATLLATTIDDKPASSTDAIIEDITESEDVQRVSRLRSLLNKFMTTATDLESKNTKGTPNDVQ